MVKHGCHLLYADGNRQNGGKPNLSRSPPEFNYPSCMLRITTQSPKCIICSNPSVNTFISA